MNRTNLGILALVFSFFCMIAVGFNNNYLQTVGNLSPTPVPERTNPSDPTPTISPYKNPSDPTPTISPYKNPSDPKSSPQKDTRMTKIGFKKIFN